MRRRTRHLSDADLMCLSEGEVTLDEMGRMWDHLDECDRCLGEYREQIRITARIEQFVAKHPLSVTEFLRLWEACCEDQEGPGEWDDD